MIQAENFNKIQPGNSVAKQLDSEAKKKAEQNRKLLKPNTYCTLSWATSTHFCSLDLKLTKVYGTTKLRKLVIKLEFCLIFHTANRDKFQTGPPFASPNYSIILFKFVLNIEGGTRFFKSDLYFGFTIVWIPRYVSLSISYAHYPEDCIWFPTLGRNSISPVCEHFVMFVSRNVFQYS